MSVLMSVCSESVVIFPLVLVVKMCVSRYIGGRGRCPVSGKGLTKKIKKLPTDMNVPGKKNKVTSVMIFMDTVSDLVLRVISLMS